MKAVFICSDNSVDTEMTERKDKLQIPTSKLQRSSKFQTSKHGLGAWLLLICLSAIAVFLRDRLPAWVFMWLVAFAIYLGCKGLTWRRARRHAAVSDWYRAQFYFLLWPGMDAKAFCS